MQLNLRTLMFYKNVNQTKLSKDTGISAATISRYYNNTFNNINKGDIDKREQKRIHSGSPCLRGTA